MRNLRAFAAAHMYTTMPLLWLISAAIVLASPNANPQQTYVIPFSGAIYITVPAQGSPAVPAQCPAHAPVSCSSIGQPNYCCPSGNYCGWANAQVGCCPSGSTCNGWAAGGNGNYNGNNGQWQPTTTYCPAGSSWNNGGWCEPAPVQTVYVQTTYYAAGGGYYQATTTRQADTGQYTQGVAGQGQYCSTLYAQGPGLPTVRAGQCGQILVLPANKASLMSGGIGWSLFMAVLGMQLLWRRMG